MNTLKSWRALLVREYLEHRIAFLYFPAGILIVLTLSAAFCSWLPPVYAPVLLFRPTVLGAVVVLDDLHAKTPNVSSRIAQRERSMFLVPFI